VGDERAEFGAVIEAGAPTFDGWDEARHRKDPGRRRTIGSERERVAHHRPHREAAEHGALRPEAGALPQLVVELGEQGVGGVEGLGLGKADARYDVPVAARPSRQLQGPSRRDDVQPPPRVEHVGEGQQVVLIGAAAVVQYEQPVRLTGGRTLAVDERAHGRRARRRAVTGA
jgi:hypothetical protein